MCRKKLNADSSGQLLIVSALAIAIVISSTAIYVYELSKEPHGTSTQSLSNFVLAFKQSTINTMISSLANVSNGGEKTILIANLDKLSRLFRTSHRPEIFTLDFAVLNDSTYNSGIRLSWDANDSGISSAYANFTSKAFGLTANMTLKYAVNITSTITINGYYTKLVSDEKLVRLTCNTYNEGESALAENITLFYEKFGSWIRVDSSNNLSIMDYGNGTYSMSFTVSIPTETLLVSAQVYDLRGIFVQADTTCYEA